MPDPNHKCVICGTLYYCCESRERLRAGSWNTTCCSPECYYKYIDIMDKRIAAQKQAENDRD